MRELWGDGDRTDRTGYRIEIAFTGVDFTIGDAARRWILRKNCDAPNLVAGAIRNTFTIDPDHSSDHENTRHDERMADLTARLR
ncbi:hypothetical protein FGK63_05580 [Ruegeria sediminis]|uniref:Uncharacterized protein n=1 Tax=Ruegeria sediminis TaxID=2583820 RepID=A0ABY2X0W3_9RHOB|nr:hypothetical protein FGK63_05580 [Ruegeria sediminis]